MSIASIFYAFCGGAFAAAIGSLGAFVFTGVLILISTAALFGSPDSAFLLFNVSFGPYLLPASTFAGGAAALHYARKRGYLPYGEGKNIAKGLFGLQKLDVIVFGGFIAVIGYMMNYGLGKIGLGAVTDTGAASIVIIALLLKLIFDHTLIGTLDEKNAKLGRYNSAAASWQPAMTKSFDKAFYGAVVGGLSACCTALILKSDNEAFATYGIYLPFAISIIVLGLCMIGIEAPVTHHITLTAAYCMAFGGGNIGWGVVTGIVAVYVADFLSRTFYIYGDCHVDPPACSIAVTPILMMYLLPKTGIYQIAPNILPYAIVAAILVVCAIVQYAGKKNNVMATAK